MKQEFLPKNPEESLRRVREILYDRLEVLRQCLQPDDLRDPVDGAYMNEIEFISELLDMIERS